MTIIVAIVAANFCSASFL